MAFGLQKNKKLYNFLIVPLIIVCAAFLRAVCVEVFTLPYNFAPGGSTGVAAIIEYTTGFSAGWSTFLINAPLLVLAFIFLSKEFALKSAAEIIVSSGIMLLMEHFGFPTYENGEPVLAAVASGALGGIALAMMLRIGGSTGGTDIIAMFIQRKFSATNVAWFIYLLDAIIVLASVFVYKNGLTPVLMSLTEMFCLASLSDVISSGFKTALKFEIITKEPDALSEELITKLGRGVTCLPARGMYSKNDESLLICVIRKRQLSEFNAILQKYKDTFAYVTSTSEVMGLGFSRFANDAPQTPGGGNATTVGDGASPSSDGAVQNLNTDSTIEENTTDLQNQD